MAIKIKRKKPEAPEVAATEEADPNAAPAAPAEPEPLELLAEDPVYQRTWSLFTWVEENRQIVIGGIAVLFIGMVAVGGLLRSRATAVAEASERLYAASDIATGTVGAAEGSAYDTVLDREAALAAAAQVVQGTSGGPAALAGLLNGRALVATDDAAGAVTAYAAGAAALPEPEATLVRVQGAVAQAAAGEVEPALGALREVAGSDGPFKLEALRQIAVITDSYGEPRAALDAWRAFIAEVDGETGYESARNRIALLELELGVEPEAEAPAAEGSGATEGSAAVTP
jgi:hypothetical protein